MDVEGRRLDPDVLESATPLRLVPEPRARRHEEGGRAGPEPQQLAAPYRHGSLCQGSQCHGSQ